MAGNVKQKIFHMWNIHAFQGDKQGFVQLLTLLSIDKAPLDGIIILYTKNDFATG